MTKRMQHDMLTQWDYQEALVRIMRAPNKSRAHAALIIIVLCMSWMSVKQSTSVIVQLEDNETRRALDLPQHDEEQYIKVDGFVGSPASTFLHLDGGCECELMSEDCLDAIRCLPADPLQKMYAGVITRNTLKQRASYWASSLGTMNSQGTIGVASHETSVVVWKEWLSKNKIPKGLLNQNEPFVNGTRYPYCRGNNLEGRACFINAFGADEEYGEFEKEAITTHQRRAKQEEASATKLLESLQKNPYDSTTYDYLMGFAHVSHVAFNLRSHLLDIYSSRLVSINHNKGKKPVLRVALHVRRGDACDYETSGFAKDASRLDTPAQATPARLCYDTKVYIDAILRVVKKVPDRHIEVYLSTDHTASLTREIETSFPEEFRTVSWKYLRYERSIFAAMKQEDENLKSTLGEATLAELWHLSHGQVFIGHLGSRFGKMGWWQATARHNAFVPFFTVDGHSVCCDIDEACGAAAPHVVSLENCLAIFWPDSKYADNINQDEYWKKGTNIRRYAAVDERKHRRDNFPKYKLPEQSEKGDLIEVPSMIFRDEPPPEAIVEEPDDSESTRDDSDLLESSVGTNTSADEGPHPRDNFQKHELQEQSQKTNLTEVPEVLPREKPPPEAIVEGPDDSELLIDENFIGSPASTIVFVPDPEKLEDCECDLTGIDCIQAMRCLPTKPLEQMYRGVVARDVIKGMATFVEQKLEHAHAGAPIGTIAQYATVSVWRDWVSKNEISDGFESKKVAFVNETSYPLCVEKGLLGHACIFHRFSTKEVYGDLEQQAVDSFQGKRAEVEKIASESIKAIRDNPYGAITSDYLWAFAHLSHLTFNMRRHMHKIYHDHLQTINHNDGKGDSNIIRVALHIRRGDACRNETVREEQEHSRLDSPPQYRTNRKCYHLGVYVDSVVRISQNVPEKHVVVYLATDSPKSLVTELREEFPEAFKRFSWKFLDYPRDVFNYSVGTKGEETHIDSLMNQKKGLLGERALLDIWHLSHGQVYVGHLGSRFGKTAWFQAMARHDAFVPFFTVDGHSVCCELDEPCGAVAEFVVSLESCLAIFWPDSQYKKNEDEATYREKGSMIRMEAAEAERRFRKHSVPEFPLEPQQEEREPLPPHVFAGSPGETAILFGDCECELMSIDCLHTLRCLPSDPSQKMYGGVITRSVIKKTSQIADILMADIRTNSPIGMGSQAVSTIVWKGWLMDNTLPTGLIGEPDAFVNETKYEFCRENGLVGRRCFLNDFATEEEYGTLEKEAVSKHSDKTEKEEKAAVLRLEALRSNPFHASVADYLTTFAHVSRITLNVRSHLLAIYNDHVKFIDHNKNNLNVLRVAMHFRRGDSCRHETSGYDEEASPLDSPAQISVARRCYATNVYMEPLRRVIEHDPDRHVIVYVATDHSGSLMEEIKSDFPDLYNSLSWSYLEYSREIFDYFGGKEDDGSFIESPRNKNRPILGETAIADIWHLSHGQVFIGHLGSRFGKLGWWQAIARYNFFVPFFTVDGHSICCDIDEACGKMAEHVVSMENCLATFWPATRYTEHVDSSIYFTEGANFRKEAAADERRFRNERESQDFIGSPVSTNLTVGDCQCQLVSIDCLDSVRCLDDDPSRKIHAGIVTRSIVRQLTTYRDDPMGDIMPNGPVGKASQFVSIKTWREWLAKNEMPKGLVNDVDSFIDEKIYPYCKSNDILGRRCFIDDFDADEEYGDIEKAAMVKHQSHRTEDEQAAKATLQSLQKDPFEAASFDYLVIFSHISKITLNFRSHVHKLYEQHLTTVGGKKTTSQGDSEFRVSMHFRRGDSCLHATTGYEKQASPLDSRPQMGVERLCYETAIYMKALQRVVDMVPDQHVVVYLATDHSQSLIDEIKDNFSDLFNKVSWRYLNYSREIFDYLGGRSGNEQVYIEGEENEKKPQLGETGLADIWHLSHGRVFIGHLGSRFGKLGWIQATARYNSFVPFYTVDGHSVCCDIDEACGENAEHIVSMENCMGVYWAESVYIERTTQEEYYTTGAGFRKFGARDELLFRKARKEAASAV